MDHGKGDRSPKGEVTKAPFAKYQKTINPSGFRCKSAAIG